MKFSHTITLPEMGAQMLAVCLPITLIFFLGYVGQTSDVEVWNGKVTDKSRSHGHYEEAYSCHCYTDSEGMTHCQTCYEDRYTVTWKGFTTVGDFVFKHLDRGSSSVYNTPDPKSYVNCTIGEPASIEHTFKNLVKAVPDSIFNNKMTQSTFPVPAYPTVRSFYKLNRVIDVNSGIKRDERIKLNDSLNKSLITLGAQKQVNIIVILTDNKDPMYRYAVENQWLGGKKNDVTVFVGLDGDNIIWADVMAFGLNIGNETLQVKLRDNLKAIKTFNSDAIHAIIVNDIKKYYTRPTMESFSYLEDAIEIPTWVIILSIIITLGGSIFLTFYFHTNDVI